MRAKNDYGSVASLMLQEADRVLVRQIHLPGEFRRILAQERARSDRSGMQFCLVVFSLKSDDGPSNSLTDLGEILLNRLRGTDEIGWFSEHQLGAVLPYTQPAEADVLAEDLVDQLPEANLCISIEIYAHPQAGSTDHSEHSDNSKLNGDDSERHEREREPVSRDKEEATIDMTAIGMGSMFARSIPRWKRVMDIVIGGLALIILSPLMLIIACCVKLTSPGPAIYKQSRSGLGGRPFMMYKFRSMRLDAERELAALLASNENDGPAFKMRKDPRVTKFGRFIRKTSLDELPQLWNVIRGDMSLVGPRPLPCHESDASESWHRRRLDVTPGVTCIWQATGRSSVSFDNWVRMDIQYMKERSLWTDVKLLFQTAWAIATCRGAH